MLSFAGAYAIVRASLAAEYGCAPEDLRRTGVLLTALPPPATLPDIARRYPPNDPPLKIVSCGPGAVVSVRPDMHATVAALLAGLARDDLFNIATLDPLIRLLGAHGFRLVGPHLRLLCGADMLRPRLAPPGYAVQTRARPELAWLQSFDTGDWPNATGARMFDGRSPTAALAVARCGAALVGVASLGAEAARLRQIGIDVAEAHQGRGVGVALVSALAAHALGACCVPWYGVAPANIASIQTALAAGFRHGWVELYALPI